MKQLEIYLLFFLLSLAQLSVAQHSIVLAVHGGAGTISRENMTAAQERAYRDALEQSLLAGYQVLKSGGKSVDAVQAAIVVLEDNPLFNAGRGAVFTNEGRNEMDASIMDGGSGLAGAMAGITTVKNPILGARAVMDRSKHVLMAGKGAEKFAKQQGLTIVHPSYFFTESRYRSLMNAKKAEQIQLDHQQQAPKSGFIDFEAPFFDEGKKFGTVGCVALDQFGNLAAGTSTGGMTNKRYGRVGDSPVIGAGTYANNETCAVSATGHGEFFIREVVAYDISALMNYRGLALNEAANQVVMKKLVKKGGEGGVIALDRSGNLAMPFNTSGMYRGFIKSDGKPVTQIFKTD